METEFVIRDEYIELIKLLKATGICESGGEAKRVTEEGLVKVDGNTESRKRRKLRKGQTVCCRNQTVRLV